MIKYLLFKGTKVSEADGSILETLDTSLTGDVALWVDIQPEKNEEIEMLSRKFNLDPYAVEDVITGKQRPKIEDYKDYTFSVIRTPENISEGGTRLVMEELFVFFSKKWIISVHSTRMKVVDIVEKRVRVRGLSPYSKVASTDLVYYLLLDNSVDSFYPILDSWDDKLDMLDEEAVSTVTRRKNRIETVREVSSKFGEIRSDLSQLRNTITPTRDILSSVMKGAVPFIQTQNLKNFRDIYDHTFQLVEIVDSYINRASDIRSLYLDLMAAMTNEVLRLLTIVATIFLPLSLLAGIFGTNFTSGINIPLTHLNYGFYIFVVILVALGGTLIILFRRNGWV